MMEFTDQLKKTYLFADLISEEYQVIEQSSARINYAKGDLIFKQGTFSSHAFYLLEGYAKIYLEKEKSKRIVKLVKPNWFIGLLSIFSYENHRFSASALTDCEVYTIPVNIIEHIMESNVLFMQKFIKEVSLLGTNVSYFMVLQNSKNVRGKIAEILIHLSDNIYKSDQFELNFTRRELGDLANTSTETAIRILADLKKEGAVDLEGNKIIIRDKQLLEKISSLG